ncbi:MAG: holliday junction helicase RuvA [Actinomycetota bacterium]|jgi:Holliday junction DNA helicase RuvA|nr:holliday junction helicase RuvA [Actinomycetota bacterium]
MIGYLRGSVLRAPDGCFVDVAGIGYRVACSATTVRALPADGDVVQLWTHLHVRDDALTLFGFASEAEQKMFEALLSVGSVGPKLALQICSAFTPESFRKALVTDDVGSLSSVSGVGKKTAQRILVDLKDKLDLPDLALVGSAPDAIAQARSALENLGYSSGEVRVALGELDGSDDVEDLLRSALKVLAG